MLERKQWEILVVDDDPDVLAVTRLALKAVQVYGIPLRIHECKSGAEAVEFLRGTAAMSDLALAIVDVVMETEHAGLDVCRYMREELGNRITPIVVRTGQAGRAPEREVIERYDISTYLTKVEATNEKLYTTVINAVRNFQYAILYECLVACANWVTSQRRETIMRDVPQFFNGLLGRRDGLSLEGVQFHFCVLTDREAVGVGNFTGREAEARALRDRLRQGPLKPVNSDGDQYANEGSYVLFSLAGTDAAPVFDIVGETNLRPVPDFVVRGSTSFTQCLRNRVSLIS